MTPDDKASATLAIMVVTMLLQLATMVMIYLDNRRQPWER